MKNQYGFCKNWTQQETDFLEENYGKITVKEISKNINRTEKSILNKAFSLKIHSDLDKISNKGKKFSEEAKRKMSLALKSHIVLKETRRKISEANIGKIASIETKEKMSMAHKKRWQNPEYREKMGRKFVGKNNPAYKDGKGNSPYPVGWKSFREPIRQRDNYRCQICGIHQKKLTQALSVHHIDRNEKNLDPLNLISLCRFHHAPLQFFDERVKDYFYAINLGELPRK